MRFAAVLAALLFAMPAAAVDLAELKQLVTGAPYAAMTDSDAFAAVTKLGDRVWGTYYINDRDLYDALGPAKAEQFLGVLTMLSDATKYGSTASTAQRAMRWLDTSGPGCAAGLNVGTGPIREWLETLANAAPSIAPLLRQVLGIAVYQSTPARDAGIVDSFTVGDVAAARALP